MASTPVTQSVFPTLGKPATFTQPVSSLPGIGAQVRKSTEQISESIISDHIKDEYEEDFEIEESNRPKNTQSQQTAAFGKQVVVSHEDSSGGFEEHNDLDDYF